MDRVRTLSASGFAFGLWDRWEGGRWVRCARGRSRGDVFQSLNAPPRPREIVYRRCTPRSTRPDAPCGERAAHTSARLSYDGGRVEVLVVCWNAPTRPRTKHGLQMRFCRRRDEGVSFALGCIPGLVEGGREMHWTRRRGLRLHLRLFPRRTRGAIRRNEQRPRRCDIAVVFSSGVDGSDIRRGWGGSEDTNHVRRMSSHRPRVDPRDARPPYERGLCAGETHAHLEGVVRVHSETLTTSVSDGCWLVCSGSEPRNGDRRRW